MTAATIYDIPPELFERVTHYLTAAEGAVCARTCRYLHNAIMSSPLYLYNRMLYLSASQDNPSSTVPISDRLTLLNRREEAWKSMNPDFTAIIDVPFSPGGLYDLANGKYFLGDISRQSIFHIDLPKNKEDAPAQWQKFNMQDGREILDFAVSVDEHDMLAAVTYRPDPLGQYWNMDLAIRKLSTSLPHPDTNQPDQHLVRCVAIERPSVYMEVVGDYLALVLSMPFGFFLPPALWRHFNDNAYVLNWKTGETKLHISTDAGVYSGLAFLTDKIIILPNVRLRSLEVWEIPEDANTVKNALEGPIASFILPPLKAGWAYHIVSCRGDPNPMGASSTRRSPDPFQPSPATALLLLNVYVHHERPAALGPNDQHSDAFNMLIRRDALLAILQEKGDIELPWEEWSSAARILCSSEDAASNWITTTSGLRYVSFDRDKEVIVRDFNKFNQDPTGHEQAASSEPLPLRKALYDEKERTPFLDILIDDVSLPSTVTFGGIQANWSGALMDEERIIGLQKGTDIGVLESLEIWHFG